MTEQTQQQQQNESLIFMPSEHGITPRLTKLFEDIDVLINRYVVDTGEQRLYTTQRFVGWHVCQDFYRAFQGAFEPPAMPKKTGWTVFQKEEYARYRAEQIRNNEEVAPYKTLQGSFSKKYSEVKRTNPEYHQQLKETANAENSLTPKKMHIKFRDIAYKKHKDQLIASLKFMQDNYNMHYIFAYTHVTSRTRVYQRKMFTSKGGAQQTWDKLQNKLSGGSILELLNNNVHLEVDRQAGINAERLAAAAREKGTSSEMAAPSLDVIPSEMAAEDAITDEHAFGGGNDDDDADYIPVDLEGEGDSAHEGQDGLHDEAVDDSSVAIPRLVRAATAIQPSEMPFPSLPATPALFEPSPVAVNVDVQLSQQRRPKPKVTKLKADLQPALITRYNEAAPPEDQRKNFPWRLFSQPDPKYYFKDWKWEGPVPKSFADIKVEIMEELLKMLDEKKISIQAVGKNKKKTTEEADGQEKRIRR